METRIREINISKWAVALYDEWNYEANYNFIDEGRILILWKNILPFSVVGGSDQGLTILGDIAGHKVFITAVYGSNNSQTRRGLWEYLRNLENDVGASYWVVRGDFNIVAEGCMEDLELQDHPFVGPIFTWYNKQEGSYLAWKLDRILINPQWMLDFPVSFAASGRLKPILKDLNRTQFSDISSRVAAKRAELEHIQLANLAAANQAGIEEEKKLQAALVDFKMAELDFYRQRAKVHWLQEGDLSTKFFHQKVESQKKKNTIRVLKNKNGQLLEKFDGMAAELVDFYNRVIGAVDPLVKSCNPEWLKDVLNYSLPAGAESTLEGEISDKEIKEALFRQGRDKIPSPYGYTFWFFKAAWEIINRDFLIAMRYFFQYSFLLPTFNATTIVLVPKSLNYSMAKEFRPISCCSVVYKIITRILVTRLAQFFPVLGVLSILDKFYDLSGLKLNAMKTKIYSCGISGGEVKQIRNATGFRVGQLPVRYLGVPLVTRKLSGTDCKASLDKIKGKLRQWSRQLILPKGVILDIERLCMRFFWNDNDSPARGARVNWSQIYSPKLEGGLGLRSLAGWNKTCFLMLIKNLLDGEGSLWIAWIKAYCFKQDDYWNVTSKPSWTLRKLIKMRE
ncbi:uncharacterized protein LOC120171819 [Hibiscus syriacus]|uniref:uncharacterized protein LOC120171819 n=1 Tax=Hibiscus syriacus TaxID=106335 RepID=UPI001923E620|nr:uncharacterized protein LOC120171819 [Hibiscus syriacus]